MNFLQIFAIALVEGITEFLPISSTGHMILVSNLLGIPQTDFIKSFEIFIQLGAIGAITLMYSKSIFTKTQLWKPIGIAFLPAALVGLFFYKFIKTYLLGNAHITVLTLFIGGILLILFEYLQSHQKNNHHQTTVNAKQAVIIGIAQSFSVIPGVSRSAATIIGGQISGLTRIAAVDFSFLLAIPTMLAATVYDLVKSKHAYTGEELFALGTGFIVAFISAWITVSLFRKFVQKYSLIHFGIYRILLALLFWIIIL